TISRSKLPGYFLPAIGPLSILIARLWTSSKEREGDRMPDWLTAAFATLVGVGLLLFISPRLTTLRVVRVAIEKKTPQELVDLVKGALVYSGVMLAAVGILGRNLTSRARRKIPSPILLVLLLAVTPFMLLQWTSPIRRYMAQESSRQLAEEILNSPQRDLPLYGYYYFRTSLPFYLLRPVGIVTTGSEELTSNFVTAHWPNIQPEMERAGFTGGILAPGLNGLAGPLVRERVWRTTPAPSPALVILQNGMVPGLFRSRGEVIPRWNGWQFSVWEVPGSAPSSSSK
ncbi:MAG TPA: hypothetical protein VFM21_06245, partial [Terriglobia bacterium]|nr:hypothetical protein [Terriglobia bacterium]